MAVATAAFAPPPPPSSPMEDKPTYRTRLASAGVSPSPRKPANMQLNVNIGAHNLRILKKAGGSSHGHGDTPRSTASTPTPTSSSHSSKQRKYERKSKRFIWPDELHRLFVAAIFDVGLKNASPKALLSIMLGAGVTSELTTEHLKSHLQKYRLNYERSRLEFLEFYDESARRSHKRRRKNSQSPQSGRGNNSSSDHNSGFVFPISHKRSRSDDDDDESSDDGSGTGAASDVENGSSSPIESPREVPAPTTQRRREPVKSEPRPTVSATKSSPAAKTQPAKRPPPPQQTADPVTPSYAVPITPFPGSQETSVSAALPTPATVTPAAYPALTTLNDPQWNILNSLISPQLAAHRGSLDTLDGSAAASTSAAKSHSAPATSSSTTFGSFEPLSLQDTAPADLQMQMHLAMQAQMNLHRQMLTRKVEVSQHGLPAQPQLRPQQQPLQLQQQQVQSGLWNNTSVNQQGLSSQQHEQPPPQSMAGMQSSRLFDGMLTDTNDELSSQTSYLGSLTDSRSNSIPTSSSTAAAPASSGLLGLNAMADFAVDATALASLDATSADKLDESEALADLYRWDKMDFSMEIDDDDLFGFLKA